MLCAASVPPLLALALCAPPSRPLVAEVFYDAVGDDTGHEFVELFHPSPQPFPLAGVRLEAGDGAGPGRWTLRWTGAATDTIRGGGRFVIGGARVTPAPDAVVQLDLQNGPDAVRLVWADGVAEVIGWGNHAWSEYHCGSPAPDVPAGLSLARIPDDADRGGNALDFGPATPSPGGANRPGRDAAMVAGSLAIAPERPEPGSPADLGGVVANRGAEPIAEHELEVRVSEAAAGNPLAATTLGRAIAPGDTARFTVTLPGLAAGRRWLRVEARLAGDDLPANDADSLAVRIGPGPLEVTEIQFHPTAGEGEWVEVRNRSGAPLDPAQFTLSDRRGAPGLATGGAGLLASESLAVYAQDPAALRSRYPALDGARLWQVKPWSALNNGNDSAGIADIVILRELDGTPCDRVPYSAAGVPAGVPVERRADGSWGAAGDPAGSPLAPPRPLPALAARFAVTPRRLAPAGGARIGWDLPWPRGRIAVDLYDLAGRHVAQVLAETSVAARGERRWVAAGIPPGVYVIALIARAEGGGGVLTATQPVRVDGRVP